MTRVYFGTNRRPNDLASPTSFDGEFSQDGLANLRFGEANVSRGKVKTIDVYDEDLAAATPTLGSASLFQDLQQRMKKRDADVLIFIHGFNVDFNEALTSAAQMANKFRIGSSNVKPDVLVFSWPSDGVVHGYRRDRHDAAASGLAVARGLEKVVGFLRDLDTCDACDRRIHLLAHSMGCYVLRSAVREMAKRFTRLPGIIDQMILTAADEDDDALELNHKLARLHELCNRVTIYFNANDKALATSDITKGNPDRLGTNGPRNARAIHRNYVAVDCGKQSNSLLGTNHSYHIESDRVIKDVNQVLDGKTSRRQHHPHTNNFSLR